MQTNEERANICSYLYYFCFIRSFFQLWSKKTDSTQTQQEKKNTQVDVFVDNESNWVSQTMFCEINRLTNHSTWDGSWVKSCVGRIRTYLLTRNRQSLSEVNRVYRACLSVPNFINIFVIFKKVNIIFIQKTTKFFKNFMKRIY